MPRSRNLLGWPLLLLVLPTLALAAEESPEKPDPIATETPAPRLLPAAIAPEDWLVLPRVGDYRRAPLHIDPIEAQIARGEWAAPTLEGVVPKARGGNALWRADEAPRSADLAGGYAYAEFDSPAAGVMLLEAAGCAAVCLNGEWLPGDPYAYGWFRPPASVVEGKNWVLVHLARPSAKPRFTRPKTPIALLAKQATLPDLLPAPGGKAKLWASVPMVNATNEPLTDAELRVHWEGDEPKTTPLRSIASRLVTPISFELPPIRKEIVAGTSLILKVEVVQPDGEAEPTVLAAADLSVQTVTPSERRVETFYSQLDGSVQPYAVLPATGGAQEAGLLVALHDAGQTTTACLDGYEPREGVHVIAPTGRGRWAFDWEDWSRLDAIEAIEAFEKRRRSAGKPIDADRVALTGRGMGGHGALSLATLEPDRFAAVGVVDGWISFFTQGGSATTPLDAEPIAKLLGRQAAANDPLRALVNLSGMGVSVLHTGRDRVPVEESRYLRERLGGFHNDFAYREPTAGEAADDLLAEQQDWLIKRRRRDGAGEEAVERLEFSTPHVGALATHGWVTLLAADLQGEVAGVRLRRDLSRREIDGTTNNARRLRISFADWPSTEEKTPIRLRLDGGAWIEFTPGRDGDTLALACDEQGVWQKAPDITRGGMTRFAGLFKAPIRPGGFDSVFASRPVLVYGTRGSKEEQSWAAAKARYDAHLFLYRGAGRLDVVADTAFNAAQTGTSEDSRVLDLRTPRRSVVLYGNRSTNSAWTVLRREAFQRRQRTIRLEAGNAWVGKRPEAGDDLAMLAVRPRFGGRRSSIGVVGGTGIVGMRMTTRLRYFWSGVEYPDLLIYGPGCLAPAADAPPSADVRAAGYFDADWGIDSGGILWRDPAI